MRPSSHPSDAVPLFVTAAAEPPPLRLRDLLGHRLFLGVFGAVFSGLTAFTAWRISVGYPELTELQTWTIAGIDQGGWAVVALVSYAASWWLAGTRLAWPVRVLLAGLLVVALVLAFTVVAMTGVTWVLGTPSEFPLRVELEWKGPSRLMGVATYFGTGFAIAYFARWRADELTAARLAAEVAESRTDALAMEMQPAFLFDTFRAIQGRMYDDPREANRMLARLSELLRMTLSRAGRADVTLAEELEALGLYVDIERTRLGPRFTVDVRGADDEVLREARVPALLLQPLVERAVRRGDAAGGDVGVRVGFRREGAWLHATVEDDAAAGPDEAGEDEGLAITRERMAALYGARATLDAAGCRVTLRLPLDGPREEAA